MGVVVVIWGANFAFVKAAIAQISPLLDSADFDGAALLSNDPYNGATIHGGSIQLTDGPGLGATPAPSVDLSAAFQSA